MALALQCSDEFTVEDVDLPVPNGDPDVTYTLRPLSRDARKAIWAKHTKPKANPKTHRMEPWTDVEAVGADTVDHVLIGWTGIFINGEPAPCERANKLMLDEVRLVALVDKAGYTQEVRDKAKAESF